VLLSVRVADSSSILSIPLEVADVVNERLVEWQLTQHAHEERAQVIDAQVAKTDKRGWFKRKSWLEYFANRNLIPLAHQIRLPDQGEGKLGRAAKLTELLVERCVQRWCSSAIISRSRSGTSLRWQPSREYFRALATIQHLVTGATWLHSLIPRGNVSSYIPVMPALHHQRACRARV
jgi:hypothetical protein